MGVASTAEKGTSRGKRASGFGVGRTTKFTGVAAGWLGKAENGGRQLRYNCLFFEAVRYGKD
jgi:hypothetical protein